jgi:hypothetical protein
MTVIGNQPRFDNRHSRKEDFGSRCRRGVPITLALRVPPSGVSGHARPTPGNLGGTRHGGFRSFASFSKSAPHRSNCSGGRGSGAVLALTGLVRAVGVSGIEGTSGLRGMVRIQMPVSYRAQGRGRPPQRSPERTLSSARLRPREGRGTSGRILFPTALAGREAGLAVLAGTQPRRGCWKRRPPGDVPRASPSLRVVGDPWKRRRNSIAAGSSPSWSKTARIAAASAVKEIGYRNTIAEPSALAVITYRGGGGSNGIFSERAGRGRAGIAAAGKC